MAQGEKGSTLINRNTAAKAAARASRRWNSSPMYCFQKVKGMPLRKVGDTAYRGIRRPRLGFEDLEILGLG